MQGLLTKPRREYSTDFSSVFEDETNSYRGGLIFLACLFLGIVFIWSFILLSLKCKGDAVGCASGGAFRQENEHDVDKRIGSRSTEESTGTRQGGSMLKNDFDDSSFHSSIPSDEEDQQSLHAMSTDQPSVYSAAFRPSRREKRTQIAFFFFGSLTFACIPLALIFSVEPLKDSVNESLEHVEDAREVVNQVNVSLNTIKRGIASSLDIVQGLPLTQSEVCPEGNATTMESELGFQIDSVIGFYSQAYATVETQVSDGMKDITKMIDATQDSLDVIETAASKTENVAWVVPTLLLALGTLTTIALFGVVVAWKRNSNQIFQRFLSYGILPFFIAISLVCWIMGIGAAVSTAVGSDICTSGKSHGSPAATLEALLEELDVDSDSIARVLVASYTFGCESGEPTTILTQYETDVKDIVETIWQYLSAVDSVGRSQIISVCSRNNKLPEFLEGLQNLAKQLTSVRKALDSASVSLSCSRIRPIYQEAIEQSLCADAITASAWGFLIFFVIGVSTMTMITLRASWRQTIPEDKIYDESEVAENMIVDEHEEYLEYISKYKHEWEEYEGVRPPISQQPGDLVESTLQTSELDGESTSSGTGTCDHVVPVPMPGTKHEPFDPYNSDATSQSTSNSEDISFFSLTEAKTPDNATSPNCLNLPLPLLHKSSSLDTDDDSLQPPVSSPKPNEMSPNAGLSKPDSDSEHNIGDSCNEPLPSPHGSAASSSSEDHIVSTTGEPFELRPPTPKAKLVEPKSIEEQAGT